jgi:FkbM family methyltransferase
MGTDYAHPTSGPRLEARHCSCSASPYSTIVSVLSKILKVLWIGAYRIALLRSGVFASTEHDRILAGLQLNTVIDIGANRGQFALCVRRLYPSAQIFSFEPLEAPSRKFRRNFGRDPRARLSNVAISTERGSVAMHVTRRDVSSSILPIGQAQRDNFPFTDESRQEIVSTAPLGDYLSEADMQGTVLLKLDVQGYELTALNGCGTLLDLCKYVYIEVSFVELYIGQALATEIVALLFARGFELRCVANLSRGRSVRPLQADFLFARA